MALTKTSFSMTTGAIVNVKDFGAVGDGVNDDTAGIQAAIDYAAQMYSQAGFPPAGAPYNPTSVVLPPGAYRITDSLYLYPGITLTGASGISYTTESTRIIMDTDSGTTNLDKHIIILTVTFNGSPVTNNFNGTIQDLGFWTINPGAQINYRYGTGFPYDPATGLGTGNGCHIYTEESTADVRVKRCNFYAVPNAAIYFNGSTTTQAGIEIHECEFDGPVVNVRFNDTILRVTLTCNEFFSGNWQLYGSACTGIINSFSNTYNYNARVKFANASSLEQFNFVSNNLSSGGAGTGIEISESQSVIITGNMFGLCSENTLLLTAVSGGSISGNTFVDSGFNASITTPTADPAAIKLVGCQNVLVSGNSISTPNSGVGSFGGFGIFCLDNGGTLSKNHIAANKISDAYTGAVYRGQSRRINLSITDTAAINTFQDFQETTLIATKAAKIIASREASVGTTTNIDIGLDQEAFSRIIIQVAATSTADVYLFEVLIKLAHTTSVYSIANVYKDGTAGAGNGPHTISAGNTVTFSISGTALRVAFNISTDPLIYSLINMGAATA
jgi:hypothetical protein